MLDELLARVFASQWLVAVFASVLLLAVSEFGFLIGRRLHQTADEARKALAGRFPMP